MRVRAGSGVVVGGEGRSEQKGIKSPRAGAGIEVRGLQGAVTLTITCCHHGVSCHRES